ncbi:hypothetical protein PVW51_20205 [Sulfitobacter sp. PR48]|uniref:hypothetical protein n=1 Tax=Sulfitobacter sp. PR48 TaxID=3028383 RepID=UPI00237A7E22|nr:hypothetical protein [Sulfitobacter sp. PR48]MDD9723036.1 hypothetical protein [Sulfitobacter sp. PR48]
MRTITINEPELNFVELIPLALSEETNELRLRAVRNVKHEAVAARLDLLAAEGGSSWATDPENANFVQWTIRTSAERREAAYEFSQTARRYEERNERRLNIAEHIGKLIWLSILDRKFDGVQTEIGILQQVRGDAKSHAVSGARDMDTLRKVWATYRGVVHLGMALDVCEEHPMPQANLLHVAEQYRQELSQNCPKGTSKPYVSSEEQISFVYLSSLKGPRFRDRGLPYDVV